MSRKFWVSILVSVIVLIALMIPLAGCSSNAATTSAGPSIIITPSPSAFPSATGPAVGGGAIINSDSVVTAQIKSITPQTTGYPWQLDILINSSQAVGTLPNPVEGKTGQVVTVKTDEDMSAYQVGDNINGKIKYTGDVPQPGITLYLYNVTKQTAGY